MRPLPTPDLPAVSGTNAVQLKARVSPIFRSHLTRRIMHAQAPVTMINAPAGFGKTMLLTQCADVLGMQRPVARVSLDASDDDAQILLSDIAAAIRQVVSADLDVLSVSQASRPENAADVMHHLLKSLEDSVGLALVLDDVHHVQSLESAQALAVLCEYRPATVQLILTAREASHLPLARLRTRGQVLELGPSDLAFSMAEAQELLRAAGVSLDTDAFDVLYERTEGWPAGLYLATLAMRESANPSRAAREFGGDDRNVFDYLSSEILTQQPAERLAFLLRTSLLERFSAPLCDAVLEEPNSAGILCELEQTNGFLMPLDNHRGWYRYHHLFRDTLRTGLARIEPRVQAGVHERASRWHEQRGDTAEAIEHALASRDNDRAALLLGSNIWQLFNSGYQMRIRQWLDAFSDADLAQYPPLAAGAAWVLGLLGDRAQTRRCVEKLEHTSYTAGFPLGETSSESAITLLKTALGWQGVSQMRAQAEMAYRFETVGNAAREHAAVFLGANEWLRGRISSASDLLEQALGSNEVGANALFALGLLGMIYLGARRFDEAQARISEGFAFMDRHGLHEYLGATALLAARACASAERGDRAAAIADVDSAVALLPCAAALPWWSISLDILAGRAARTIGKLEQAGALLAEARRELVRYPDAGMLPHLLSTEERALATALGGASGLCMPLTEAERRVLELAPTHLTLEEIGRDRCISRNTVKSHLRAIYSKLNVTSRGEAVARAQAIGLLNRPGAG